MSESDLISLLYNSPRAETPSEWIILAIIEFLRAVVVLNNFFTYLLMGVFMFANFPIPLIAIRLLCCGIEFYALKGWLGNKLGGKFLWIAAAPVIALVLSSLGDIGILPLSLGGLGELLK